MSNVFMIWFLLGVTGIGAAVGLLSKQFRTRVRGILLATGSLGIIVIILYLTQWSQRSVVVLY